jgi:hypothetical protein
VREPPSPATRRATRAIDTSGSADATLAQALAALHAARLA